MADKKAERTHRHRNIIDDVLDFGLAVLGGLWYFFGGDIKLDNETLAMIATAGASARAALRRILMKLWGHHVEEIERRANNLPESGDVVAIDTSDSPDDAA